jgi:hypothetical protein
MTAPHRCAGCGVVGRRSLADPDPRQEGMAMKRVPTPNAQGLCCYCMRSMDGDRLWFNGAYAHNRCAAEHERLILGEDAMPGLLEHLDSLDERRAFLTRLGHEAGKLGIGRQQLAKAVERAINAE